MQLEEQRLTILTTSRLLFSQSQVLKIINFLISCGTVAYPDEDWDRMEALADQQLEEEGKLACVGNASPPEDSELELGGSAESSVRAESLAKLEAFKENPHVDLNESKLATELKIILEEAQRRMEAGELEKKRKKEQKKVRIAEEAAKKGESNIIMNVLKQVEQDNGFETDVAASEMVDDDNLLDGFMEGFNEDKEVGGIAEEEDKGKDMQEEADDDGGWSFRFATAVAVVSIGAAFLGGHFAKS